MKKLVVLLLILLVVTGCAGKEQSPLAGLRVLPAEKLVNFQVPENLIQTGNDNLYRGVQGAALGEALGEAEGLELSSGFYGQQEYFVQTPAIQGLRAQLRLQFLSTQGVGRVKISALDTAGNILKTVGWVMTGAMPTEARETWQDVRQNVNYLGDWVDKDISLYDHFTDLSQVAQYRLSVEAGKGQHVIITKLGFAVDNSEFVKITPRQMNYQLSIGEQAILETDLENLSPYAVTADIAIAEPYGLGVIAENRQQTVSLAPHEKKGLTWALQAKRADAVNLNQPWKIAFLVNGQEQRATVNFSIQDGRPGQIFYVMTEDLEPIDSAGYQTAWGNSNGWIDPEEFLGQMVLKSERLNEIAGKYGAKWTHYTAWPAVKAAGWAAQQSKTGQWDKVIVALQQSITEQSKQGHEYALHMHTDYDPYLPGNILSYNPQTDGFWANHLRHGWAHSVWVEGDFSDYASRNGILYAYQQELDQLATTSGQIVNARAGSFDFGNGVEDEAKSTRVYRNIGLWGSSDADGNAGGLTSGDYGKEIYFSKPDDINTQAMDIKALGLVEFRPTPRKFLTYDSDTAQVLNDKTAQGIAAFTQHGKVQPGVHAIIGFTHAMFMMGAGNWQDLTGGQFENLNRHLQFVKENYVDANLLQFATGSELVKQYLNYYSPELIALYGARLQDNLLFSEYAITLLGQDIVIDSNHPHTVQLKYPLYLRDSAYHIAIFKNGTKIYATSGLPTPVNDINFIVTDKATYTMRIYHNSWLSSILKHYKSMKDFLVK